jgi:hypothetical protein
LLFSHLLSARLYWMCLQPVRDYAEMESVMSFDQTCGHQTLEPAYVQTATTIGLASAGEYSRTSIAIALAASCPAHGCCDDDGEELERWDGLA